MRLRIARRAAQLAAALVLGVAAWGCGDGEEQFLPGIARTRSVSGFVGNASTGRGIPSATVQVGGLSASTNARGEFTLGGLPLDDQAVTITARDFLERRLTLSANQSTIDVRLQPVSTTGGGIEPPPDTPAI